MAEKKFSLKKEIISNETAKKLNDGIFNEIALSEEKFDDDKIKGIYNDLFFQIPKRGKKSHESIIIQSLDYTNPEINENLESTINSLQQTLLEKNEEYFNKSFTNPISEHPLFPNGSFLQIGNLNTNEVINPDTADIWFMQQGMKRKVTGPSRGFWLRVLRLSLGETTKDKLGQYISTKNSVNFKIVESEDINSIDNGEEISVADDLNIHPLLGIEQEYIFDDIKLRLYCEGVEKFYKFQKDEPLYDYMLEGYPLTGGYWYLDTAASCHLTIQTDKDPGVGFESKHQQIIIPAGEHKNIRISRDDSLYEGYTNGIASSGANDPTQKEFYDQNILNTTVYHEFPGYGDFAGKKYPKMRRHRVWGTTPGVQRYFPGINKIGTSNTNWTRMSRIMYSLQSPTDWDSNGNISSIFPGWHQLTGIVDNSLAIAPDQVGILDNYPIQMSKGHGASFKMASTSCYGPNALDNCYGALGQNSSVQSLLSNPTGRYYKKNAGPGGNIKIYGQPIIKVKGYYSIFGYRYRTFWGVDWNVFYNLETGASFEIKNKDLDNHVTGYKRYSNRYFDWTPDPYYHELFGGEISLYINNPTLYFPGIQGTKVNNSGARTELLNGDRTFNNPGNKGSNFKQTNWMLENLKRG
jgi:hypothetical protein